MSNETDLKQYKRRLLERQQELRALADSGNEAAKTVELDQARVGRLSRMDALQGQAMSLEAQRRRGIELRRIAAALRRIEESEYGCCLECGAAIGSGRLQLDPAAPLCITCASEAEKSPR